MATIKRSRTADTQAHPVAPKSRLERTVLISGLVACLIGAVLLVQIAVTADPAVSLATTASSGQMTARLEYYEWISHDSDEHSHDEDSEEGAIEGNIEPDSQAQEGFARPASMMPGTPDEGFQRVQIELQMQNIAGPTTEVSPTDFWLEDDEGTWWPSLEGGTFRPTDLAAGHSVNTVLAFDVRDDKTDADMEIIWVWNGQETRFSVTGSDNH